MTAVIDASVLVASLTDAGPDGSWADTLIAAGALAAPALVHVETANVLRRLEHSGEISPLEATSAQRDMLRLDIELFPYEPFAERVWALRANVTSYDAWYIALAEALHCPLATLDRGLTRAAGPACRFLTRSRPTRA